MVPEIDIHCQLAGLAEYRTLFHSEADFQHALAWHIHDANPECQVRLEVDPLQQQGRRMFLDIWLPRQRIAIELKYATQKLVHEVGGEKFVLRNQSARDVKRYDFLRDIERLERMHAHYSGFSAGYAVMLTNDPGYWKPSSTTNTVDSDFRLHEGREIAGNMQWAENASPGTRSGREEHICVKGGFPIRWRKYSEIPGKTYGEFRYLATVVN